MADSICRTWNFKEEDETVENVDNFIENLKEVGKILQSNFISNLFKTCQEREDKIRELRILNVNLKNEVTALKSSRQTMQKRSDEYKEKFQNAQIIIEELHEKNMSLSKSIQLLKKNIEFEKQTLAVSKMDTHHPLFENPTLKKPIKSIVLAPDTCQINTHPSTDNERILIDTIITDTIENEFLNEIKADEEIIQSNDKDSNSFEDANINDLENDETMFIKPLPPESEMPDYTIDMDETHFDDRPSSPVLKQKKHSRFITPNIPKKLYNSPTTKRNLSLLLNSSTEASPSILPQVLSTKTFKQSTSFLQKSCNNDSFETSLNDLFDKTDGNLDTTVANLEKTLKKSQSKLQSKIKINLDSDDDDFLPSKHELKIKGQNAVIEKYEQVIQIENSPQMNKESKSLNFSNIEEKLASPRSLWMSDFDKLPKREKPSFKHKTVIKNRDKRTNLDGKTCAQCEAFYSNLSKEKRKEMLRKVCKHKYVHQPPSTPEHYWDVEIPSTIECRQRGYIIDKCNEESSKQDKFKKRRRR